MPPHTWATTQADAMNAVVPRDPQAARFVWWTGDAVNSLHYLADVAATVAPADEANPLGHGWQVAALAHARWATGTAVTALDLCAATLGRLHRSNCYPTSGGHEMDLKDAQNDKDLKAIQGPRAWVVAVVGDADYALVLSARHALTHQQRPTTHVGTVGIGRPTTYRTLIRVDPSGKEVGTDELLRRSIEVATRHVEAFYFAVVNGAI